MKIRNGFVSNSSSSSFVAVGIGSPGWNPGQAETQRWEGLLNAMGLPSGEFGYDTLNEAPYSGKVNEYDHGVVKTTNGSELCLYGSCEFYFVGLDAMPLFEKDMKLSEIKKKFQLVIKETYEVDIDLSDMELRSDEVSSE